MASTSTTTATTPTATPTTSTTKANVFTVQDTSKSVKLALKDASGDVVRIKGFASEYAVKLVGTTLTLVSDAQRIVLSLAKGSTSTLAFLDGSVDVNVAARTLGTQKLAATGKAITAPVDSTTPAAVDAYNYFNGVVPVTTYTLTALPATAVEGSALTFQLSLDTAPTAPVTVVYNTVAGTATTADFTSVAGTVTFAVGQTVAFVSVPTLNDALIEPTENLTLNVSGANVKSATTAVGAAISVAGSITDATPAVSASSLNLTVGQDSIVGTDGNDTFNAVIVNNSNTFQSGDVIDGGKGIDTLNVQLGSSSAFAILPATINVEKFVATVESTNAVGSNGTNNVDTTGQKATIDAQNMVGVNEYWNSDSRADLKIEDIRILDNQITKDITIGLRNTDPGSIDATNVLTGAADHRVDYEVYFSPESLRPENATSSAGVSLSVHSTLRVGAGFDATNPLKGIDYNKFSFLLDGKVTPITLDLTKVTTYAQLQTAVRAGLDAAGLTNVVLKTGTESFVSEDAQTRLADLYTLSWAGHTLAKITNGTGWERTGTQLSDNALSAYVYAGTPDTSAPLITSTIVLDNVGREDEAGTLTIGSMSTHSGVERFEITVDNNAANAYAGTQSGSWLGNIQSTNNTLEEVTVKNSETINNGATAIAAGTPYDYLYLGTNRDQAGNNLTVMQDWPGSLNRFYNAIAPANATTAAVSNAAGFKLSPTQNDIQQKVSSLLNTDGLTDVRLFDASAMKGNVYVGASITADTIRKYQNLVDALPNDKVDDIPFVYKTGAGDDSINLQIDGSVAASHSRNVTGRHDFSFLVDGGAGNDTIRVALVNGLNGNTQNWYNNQDINANVTINGGDGNDTIFKPGAGDTTINAGTGDDTVYTDNTGKQIIVTRNADGTNGATTLANDTYVFNAVDSNGGTVADGGYNLFDLRSQAAASVSAVNAQVTVNYLGIAKTVYIANSNNASANVAITDLSVNQAIKDAINNDAVLNKLLVAQDGPGRTLVVSSLIDGQASVGGDLTVTFGSTPLTSAQTGLTLFSAANALAGRYATIFAQDNVGTSIMGADSTATSDNVILPGTGNDVVVLGTTVGATVATSSNETVVYEPAFGNDTVVNFAAAGTGIDHLDFIKLGGSTLTGTLTTDKSITVATAAPDATIIGNLFSANNAAAQTHVYVAVSAHNIGSVYTITDPVGASNAVATLQGTIDLAATSWGSLTAANFVDSSVANYSLLEGPNTLNGTVTPVIPGVPTATLTSSAANINEGGSVTYTATLTGGTSATALNIPYTLSGTGITTGDFAPALAALTGTITIPANSTTGTLTLTAANDTTTEGAETLSIALGATAGVNLDTATASTVIADTSVTGSVTSGTLVANGSVAATAGADVFKLAPATGSYTTTVSGFDYLADKIQVPAGSTLPSAVAGGVNNVTDGNVDLTWANNGNVVTISLTGLNAATEAALQLNAVSATVFGTY